MNFTQFAANKLIGKKIKLWTGYRWTKANPRVFMIEWTDRNLRISDCKRIQLSEFEIVDVKTMGEAVLVFSLSDGVKTHTDALFLNFGWVYFDDGGPVEVKIEGLSDRDSIDIFPLV